MITIDERKISETIIKRKPRSVALNGAEALISKIQDSANNITERLFNIGHTVAMETFGEKVVMINAYDDASFDIVARKCAIGLKEEKYRTISLLTDSQHLHQIGCVKKIFEENDYQVIIGRGKGQLNDAQVFGCEFYPAYNIQKQVDAFIFLGQSRFHCASIAMSTEKPTFMLDPYFREYFRINEYAQDLQKKSILSVYKALDAERIGMIIGLKEGQFAQVRALELKKEFEQLGKKTQLIALTDITEDRLQNFKGIDAFVQVACPRISTDNHFKKPMLSVPQALALIKLLRKEPIDDFLKSPHWL
jgi:2-(3-amino-3-carboxypropyl)histidine synthase